MRKLNRNIVLLNNSKFNLVWQVGTGIKYLVNNRFSVEVGYLYLNRGTADTKHTIDRVGQGRVILLKNGHTSFKLTSHQALFGIEFNL